MGNRIRLALPTIYLPAQGPVMQIMASVPVYSYNNKLPPDLFPIFIGKNSLFGPFCMVF